MNHPPSGPGSPITLPDDDARRAAEARQAVLTKPPGALGRLEALAIRLAALQGSERPAVDPVRITVFAADHGVAKEGVSAYPQAVTAEMIRNFSRGGAAISVLARELDATLEVIDLGTVVDPGPLAGVVKLRLGPGTANFCEAPAMTEGQLTAALEAGYEAVERARAASARLFIAGEMGIANTTAATALVSALLARPPERLAGPGTGLDGEGVRHKAAVIRRALEHHREYLLEPREILRRLGGFEIAALVGACLACARLGVPILVDGFICTAGALVAERIAPGSRQWFLFSHASAEPGHRTLLEALEAEPLLDLGMRLGEGSGAAVALPLLRAACALHNHMATFEEAGVSGKAS